MSADGCSGVKRVFLPSGLLQQYSNINSSIHPHTHTPPSPPHGLCDARSNKVSLFKQVSRKEGGVLAST